MYNLGQVTFNCLKLLRILSEWSRLSVFSCREVTRRQNHEGFHFDCLSNHRVKGAGSTECSNPEISRFETLYNLEGIWVRDICCKVFFG